VLVGFESDVCDIGPQREVGSRRDCAAGDAARLERDGLVQPVGSRASIRKPELVYDITPDAEHLFAKAYAPALASLLEVMAARSGENDVDAQLREAGRRLAAPHVPSLTRLTFPLPAAGEEDVADPGGSRRPCRASGS
jgi:hypothetical protein